MSTYLIDDSFGLSEVTTHMLNEACEEFIQRSKIFDEVAVVQICTDRHLLHVYDFSYRNLAKLDAINAKEVKALLPLVDNLTVDEWSYLPAAKGTDFDVIYKMSPNLFLLINNTEMSIEEIQAQWCQNSFDEIRHLIDGFVRDILVIVKGAIACP